MLLITNVAHFQDCELAKSDGNKCRGNAAGSPGIRWYFNRGKYVCLAFQYQGCGGNENNFKSRAQCYGECAQSNVKEKFKF